MLHKIVFLDQTRYFYQRLQYLQNNYFVHIVHEHKSEISRLQNGRLSQQESVWISVTGTMIVVHFMTRH